MSEFEGAPRITPFLWFDDNAEEAVDFYVSVFRNAKRARAHPISGDERVPPRTMTIPFELDGQSFVALNGGPMFRFTEAISFVIRCDSQGEVDEYWAKLTDGGSEGQCGWLKDRFGVSWQVVPKQLLSLVQHPKAMRAMLAMKKIDLHELERAARA